MAEHMTLDQVRCQLKATVDIRGRPTQLALERWLAAIEAAIAERDALRARIENAPVAIMDTRDALGICAPTEEDFLALYALQGKRVRLVVEGE